jgi:hypothetical protein
MLTTTTGTAYPKDVELTLKLCFTVNSDMEERQFFKEDGSLTVGFIADMFDVLDEACVTPKLLKVQDLSYADIKKQMASKL